MLQANSSPQTYPRHILAAAIFDTVSVANSVERVKSVPDKMTGWSYWQQNPQRERPVEEIHYLGNVAEQCGCIHVSPWETSSGYSLSQRAPLDGRGREAVGTCSLCGATDGTSIQRH